MRPAKPTTNSVVWVVGALVAAHYGIFFLVIEFFRRKLGH